jgi:hypothetical protein
MKLFISFSCFFKLRASCLWGRHSTWATPSALFALLILEIGSSFFPGQPGSRSSYLCFPATTPSFCQPIEIESCELFDPSCPGTAILWISTFSYVVWVDRYMSLHPAIGWDGVLQTICPGWPWTVILWSRPPNLGLPVWATGAQIVVLVSYRYSH